MLLNEGIEVRGALRPGFGEILTRGALQFVAGLVRRHGPTRKRLLEERAARQAAFDRGVMPDFLPGTEAVRRGVW